MERVIAVNSNCYHGYSIEDAIEGISRAGFRYIELTATKGWTEHVFPSMSLSYLSKVKELCRDKGLVPVSLSGHCNLMDEKRIPDFIDNMKLAYFFGCSYIVSSIGEAHLENNAELTDGETAAQLSKLVPYLKEYGLKLVLEVHGQEHGSGAKLKRILDNVDSDLIGINYDTANAVFYGNVDIKEDMEGCLQDIHYMHLKDKKGRQDEWDFPALGEGEIDFPGIINRLEESGNQCPFSIEIEFTQDGPKDLGEVDRAVAVSGKYLQSLGLSL